jgi:hypothetical protein
VLVLFEFEVDFVGLKKHVLDFLAPPPDIYPPLKQAQDNTACSGFSFMRVITGLNFIFWAISDSFLYYRFYLA